MGGVPTHNRVLYQGPETSVSSCLNWGWGVVSGRVYHLKFCSQWEPEGQVFLLIVVHMGEAL